MAEEIRSSADQTPQGKSGPFLAKVVSHMDPTNMGGLEVELLKEVGSNASSNGQYHQVKYMSPFFGYTSVDYVGVDPNDYNNTQKSYGMWMVPPDVGTIVVVIFIEGDSRKGFWIGCVPDEKMNFMVPGYAATKFAVGSNGTDRVPVAEYNKKAQNTTTDGNHFQKPIHPFKSVLDTQGLIKDDVRGITTSSARREVPSAVFGISTPGPIDKSSNAKKGSVGKVLSKIANAFVSRLGGSSFVMDDGDDKFLRAGHASKVGPLYKAVEQGETGGDVGIPHNELIRLRTRTGHQILLHNSEDLIYIGNSRGTTWIELTSNGKIDIYAKDSVSIHTENDLNITADRDINLTSGKNINLNAGVNLNNQAEKEWNMTTGTTSKIKAGGDFDVVSANTNINGGIIHLNSGTATEATATPKTKRIPQHEPWPEHENLDPTLCTADKTIAITFSGEYVPENYKPYIPENYKPYMPSMFKQYTTKVDTFEKIAPPKK